MHRGIFAQISKDFEVLVGFNWLKLQLLKAFADLDGLLRRYKIEIRPQGRVKTDIEKDTSAIVDNTHVYTESVFDEAKTSESD